VDVLETKRSRGCDGGESGVFWPAKCRGMLRYAQRTESVAPGEHNPRLLAANRTVLCRLRRLGGRTSFEGVCRAVAVVRSAGGRLDLCTSGRPVSYSPP